MDGVSIGFRSMATQFWPFHHDSLRFNQQDPVSFLGWGLLCIVKCLEDQPPIEGLLKVLVGRRNYL